jgi:hypothetical protein
MASATYKGEDHQQQQAESGEEGAETKTFNQGTPQGTQFVIFLLCP